MVKLATILTVRASSTRLPNKALAEINGKPVMHWLYQRLQPLGKVIVATSTDKSDQPIADYCNQNNIPVYCGSLEDVVARIDGAVREFVPNATHVFRALGDCPYIEVEIVKRALSIMDENQADAFLWHLSPDTWPIYGSREFPFSIRGWRKIFCGAQGSEREHSDQYFHNNRELFDIVYHEPPVSTYFRHYRLEIDWPEDLQMVREIAKEVPMDAPMTEVVHFLDTHPEIAAINGERVEKTGPLSSYDYSLRRGWMRAMSGKPVVAWDDTVWMPPGKRAVPIFCSAGKCLVGYGNNGVLYTKSGDKIAGEAYKNCACGAGRYWKGARK